METELKHIKSVRLSDADYGKVVAISEKRDWKDAQTLNRLIKCGLKHWEAKK